LGVLAAWKRLRDGMDGLPVSFVVPVSVVLFSLDTLRTHRNGN